MSWVVAALLALGALLWIAGIFLQRSLVRQVREPDADVDRLRWSFYAVSLAPQTAVALAIVAALDFPWGLLVGAALVLLGVPWTRMAWTAATRDEPEEPDPFAGGPPPR